MRICRICKKICYFDSGEPFAVRKRRTVQAIKWKPGVRPDLVELIDSEDGFIEHGSLDYKPFYFVKDKSGLGLGREITEGDYLILHTNGCATVCKEARFEKEYVRC